MYDDDRDALAAEYVLGTLSADERDQAEALLAIDPGFAEVVRQWERRLGELNVMVEAVEPPPEVWDKLRAEIGGFDQRSAPPDGRLPAIEEAAPHTAPETTPEMTSEHMPDFFSEPAPEPPQDLDALARSQNLEEHFEEHLDEPSPVAALASALLPPEPAVKSATPRAGEPPSPAKVERSAEIIYLARDARRWRRLTLAAGAIAALLAVYIGVEQFAPGLIPLPRQTQTAVASKTQPPSRFVAVLQHEPTAPAFLLTLDPQSRTITVRRVSATAEAGRSYELWLISSKYPGPRSLGVVGGEEFTARPIPANFDVDTMRNASYAISLEASGGSTSGAPTGPVLFTGKLLESTPGSPG
jgi:anti-sigma-K factor RskA